MTDLTSKTKRRKLAARTAPHYMRLAKGLSLGWRYRGNYPAKWVMKLMVGDRPVTKVLGDAEDGDWSTGLTYDNAADLARKKAGAPRVVSDMTVGDCLDDWRDNKIAQTNSPKAVSTFHSETKLLKVKLGSIKLADLKAADLEKWKTAQVAAAADKRKVKASINRRLATLKAALNRAVKGQPGPFPWTAVAKFDKQESFAARIRILHADEEAAILNAAPSDLARFVTFMIRTGNRPGEAAAVRIENISFGNDGGGWVVTTGKTGERRIRIDPAFAQIVREWIGNRTKGPLLIRDDGLDWSDSRHVKLWNKAVRKAGVANATAYSCRDTFMSRVIRKGASIAAVAKHTGTSVEQIMNSYFSELPQEADEWLAAE